MITSFPKDIQNHLLMAGIASLSLYLFSLFFYFASISMIIGIAFDLSIISLAVGLYRLGNTVKDQVKSWKLVSILLISASVLDVVNIILYLVYSEKTSWFLVGFQVYRLISALIYYSLVVLGFFKLFKLEKKLFVEQISTVIPRLFLVYGYIITFIGFIFLWTSEFLISNLVTRPDWLVDVASYISFFSNFVIILGFLNFISFFQSIGKNKDEDLYDSEILNGEEIDE